MKHELPGMLSRLEGKKPETEGVLDVGVSPWARFFPKCHPTAAGSEFTDGWELSTPAWLSN